jgi:hypothetical protein
MPATYVSKKGADKSSMVAPLVQQIIAENEQREKQRFER